MSSVKIIAKMNCPHCDKEIITCENVDLNASQDWTITPEEMTDTKKHLHSEIKKLKFMNENERDEVVAWLDDEDTIIPLKEVGNTLNNIKSSHEFITE